MKKLNNSGIAHLPLILLIAAVIAIGAFAYVRVSDKATQEQQPVQTSQVAEEVSEQTKKTADELITELDDDSRIVLIRAEDAQKLKGKTPASFITYIEKKLAANKEVNGCLVMYTVYKYSDLNISGGVASVSAKTHEQGEDGCGGGANQYWYLQDGSWHEFASQAAITCDRLDNMNIYREFIEECLENDLGDQPGPNPNGSIADAE